MAPRNVTQLLSNEADIQLAIASIKSSQIQTNRRAATIYHVPESMRATDALERLPDAIASPTQGSSPS
jgi:hypothetical protein